jgi:hypothetical protein
MQKAILLIYQFEDNSTNFYLIPKSEITAGEAVILAEAHSGSRDEIQSIFDRITDEVDFCRTDADFNCKWSKYKTDSSNPISPSAYNFDIRFVVFVQE